METASARHIVFWVVVIGGGLAWAIISLVLLTTTTHQTSFVGTPVVLLFISWVVAAILAGVLYVQRASPTSNRRVNRLKYSVSGFGKRDLSEFGKRNWKAIHNLTIWPFVWCACLLLVPAFGGNPVVFVLWLASGVVGGFFALRSQSAKEHAVLLANAIDHEAADMIAGSLAALIVQPAFTAADSASFRTERLLRLGEVARHFDSQTVASIEGWMDHNLFLHGYGLGVRAGRIGLGFGQVGLGGQSNVHLSLTGTTRDNLLGDGFVAVLERDLPGGGIDTLRVVVPSEPAARQMVAQFVTGLGQSFGDGSYRDVVLSRSASLVASSFRTDVSYVSDRLNAVLRTQPERRPRISVVGTPVTEHALLGGAVQLEGDSTWYKLFPMQVIGEVNELVQRANNETVSKIDDAPASPAPQLGSSTNSRTGSRWRVTTPLAALLAASLPGFLVAAILSQNATSPSLSNVAVTPQPTSTSVSQVAPQPTSVTATYTSTVPVPVIATSFASVPTPTPSSVIVANTGGDGVYLRRTPQMADKLVAWPDGTELKVVGPDTDGDGTHWKNVQDPHGQIGWVPAQYVLPVK